MRASMARLAFKTTAVALAITIFSGAAQADGIVDNVNGITLDKDGKVVRFQALLVTSDGKVGKLLSAKDKRPEKLEWRVDFKGKTLLPGMIDAHGHVMDLGFRALELDLSDTKSLAEAQAKIAAHARANGDKAWIIGGGWNQEAWGLGRFPTAADLDAAVGDRPVWLSRADGHASWGNSAALKAAGITAKSVSPPGGRIEKTAAGQPSGVFVDSAQGLVAKVVPQPLGKDRNAAFLKAQSILLS